jgi:uncharacterized protein YjlB
VLFGEQNERLALFTVFETGNFLNIGGGNKMNHYQTFFLKDDGIIPNNPNLPVIFYKQAVKKPESNMESIFNKNQWLNSWTNGVFDYHHYHSNSHEVLGVIKGDATLMIGGEKGKEVHVQTGDVIVLPAGTGHKRLNASSDFSVVGAYPDGMNYNTKYGKENERPEVLVEISKVPLPKTDPVTGEEGPLMKEW